MLSKTTDRLTSRIEVRFTDDKELVAKQCDHETLAYCAIQLANEKNVEATALRDAGKINEAKELLLRNYYQLRELDKNYGSRVAPALAQELRRNAKLNEDQSGVIEDQSRWNVSRKAMRYEQSKNAAQQQMREASPSPVKN